MAEEVSEKPNPSNKELQPQEKPRRTRREFLEKAEKVTTGVAATIAFSGLIPETAPLKEPTIERKGEVVTISKPEGQYTIMYGMHTKPRDPSQIPDNLTAIVFEGGQNQVFPWTWDIKEDRNSKQKLANQDFPTSYKAGREYGSLFPQLEKDQTPIIIADAAFRQQLDDKAIEFLANLDRDTRALVQKLQERFPNLAHLTQKILEAEVTINKAIWEIGQTGGAYSLVVAMAETGIGIGLLASIIRSKENSISRREFFSRVKTGAKIGVAVWLSLPLSLPMIESFLYSHYGIQGEFIPPQWRDIIEKIHPETWFFILTLRNVILAHKEQWLMENKLGRNPHLGTVIGAAHTGLESQILRSKEERLEFLRAAKPLLKVIYVPETIYLAAQFNFDGKKLQPGKVIEIPELKALVS